MSSHLYYQMAGSAADFLRFVDTARQSPYFNPHDPDCQQDDDKRMGVFFALADLLDPEDVRFNKDAIMLSRYTEIHRNGDDIAIRIDYDTLRERLPLTRMALEQGLARNNLFVS